MQFKQRLGIIRSYLMYYGKPFGRRRLRQFYGHFVKKGDLCFDIGAHLGNRSRVFRDLGARVIAVEPQPVCIRFLEKKFASDDGFILEKVAVGESPGQLTLHISTLTPTVTTLTNKDWRDFIDENSTQSIRWDKTTEVSVKTLDDLITQYGIPTFCKIDVEDYELPVLKGLSHPISHLSFEFFTQRTASAIDCIRRIEELGDYTFNISSGESQKMYYPEWMKATALIERLERGDVFGAASGDVYASLI